ncbi:DNA repair exonuclease [Rhizobium sp. YJ-22]|uniref:metallophosphoesterase family protein n=1 Tax=Rhizobium sp. YJ-22 TaxID=3037556 RepID=UPI002412D1FD|nr:DNA repair exonuclease [Rhizobium sp. YJ-22]MDG3577168.1 DNA repair exonuclease [Rhizobium sp. YJ-22]
MTSFRFVHAADLHLGSPFQGLTLKDAGIAALFVEASRKAFSNLVTQAIAARVDFFLIAGDVYDGDWKDNKIGLFFNREMARLERENIPVYLLRGNHDAESVITRTITLPGNVHEFSTQRPQTFLLEALKVALHGQGFAQRSANDNLALTYPKPVAGWFNIGVLHTSLTGREPHAPYAPCSVDDLRSRGYDYWALGHVHDYEVVATDPLIIFPGNLQGRSIRERGSKGAVLVTVDEGRIRYERMIVDEARFAELTVTLDGDDDMSAVVRRIEAEAAGLADGMEDRPLALRLRLTGKSRHHAHLVSRRQDLRDEAQAAAHRCHQDIWLEKLDLRIEPLTLPQAGAGDALDLSALLVESGAGELAEDIAAFIRDIAQKMPGGAGAGDNPLETELADLLSEARALLQARANGEGA